MVGPGQVYAQPEIDPMTSGFRREDPPPTAKTHGSSQIGPGWSAVGSVKAENILPEVQIGSNYMFFS